jgi:hypothetical protein
VIDAKISTMQNQGKTLRDEIDSMKNSIQNQIKETVDNQIKSNIESMKNEMVQFFQNQMMTMFNEQKESMESILQLQRQQQKEQNEKMERMMQQLLMIKEHNPLSPNMIPAYATPSPAPMSYPTPQFPPIPAPIHPRYPPLQPMHMLSPPAPIEHYGSQQYTQNKSPTNEMLTTQDPNEHQGDHLLQNENVKHEMDLGADGTGK